MRKRTVETMNGRVSGRSGGCWNGPAQETGRPDPRAEVVRILMVPENEVAHVAPGWFPNNSVRQVNRNEWCRHTRENSTISHLIDDGINVHEALQLLTDDW